MPSSPSFSASLFYSYSHEDRAHRDRMEKALSLLRKQDGVLKDWSDQKIVPGQKIDEEVKRKLDEADIVVFLVSPSFIASDPCMSEWRMACEMADRRPSKALIPIILAPCPWMDVDGMADMKALPDDAVPISSSPSEDGAWKQVYEGIKAAIDQLRSTFTIRPEFRAELESSEFVSQDRVSLRDVFVFPQLAWYEDIGSEGSLEHHARSTADLLEHGKLFLRGDQLSGKTALCRIVFLDLVDKGDPVLHFDLRNTGGRSGEDAFRQAYELEFEGDYALWSKQPGRTVIVDNLMNSPRDTGFVILATKLFDRVIVAVSSDTHHSYYKDDPRFAAFEAMDIRPLTHSAQEELIRKRAVIMAGGAPVPDGRIDDMERRVNSVVIHDRLLPRYPFYILSILQTWEGFMPSNLAVTSFGHCYHAIVLAQLIKSGVSHEDGTIGSCLNIMEELAFAHHMASAGGMGMAKDFSFASFIADYDRRFILNKSLLNRMCHEEYGVITADGSFRSAYMQHYFLGKYLAGRREEHSDVIARLLDGLHHRANAIVLIFLVHHTSDHDIVEEIVIRSMVALDGVAPAKLDKEETEVLNEVVESIPKTGLSGEPTDEGRRKARELMDESDDDGDFGEGEDEQDESANDVYRILKANEVLAQILRNRSGKMERPRVREVVEAIIDGALRNIAMFALDQDEINQAAQFVHEQHPRFDPARIKTAVKKIAFLWAVTNLETAVAALNTRAIRPVIDEVVKDKSSPAHDLIGHFVRLDTIESYGEEEKDELVELRAKHKFAFFQRVISLRTQFYFNTHRVDVGLEQAACQALGIKYRPRRKAIS